MISLRRRAIGTGHAPDPERSEGPAPPPPIAGEKIPRFARNEVRGYLPVR